MREIGRVETDPIGVPRTAALTLRTRERQIRLDRPLLMGIINVNDDSFCADGRVDTDWALARSVELVSSGADILDIGAESARTNREPIAVGEEVLRLLPVIQGFKAAVSRAKPRDALQVFPPLLSINTWRPGVVRQVLPTGGDLLNDLSGLPAPDNALTCAAHGCALLIMHSVGEPKQKHTHVRYRDVLAEVEAFFAEKVALARDAGLGRDQLVLDPGIDFAKPPSDNLRLIKELGRLTRGGLPVLMPISRKSTIGKVLGIPTPAERDPGTVACMVAGLRRGASIFRLHNVEMGWRAREAVIGVSRHAANTQESC